MQRWYPKDTHIRNAFIRKSSPSLDESFSFWVFVGDIFIVSCFSYSVLGGVITISNIFYAPREWGGSF